MAILLSVLVSAPVQAQDKVVLQLRWDHQFQFGGYYAALWEGYYADEGLDVEIRSAFPSPGEILSAVDEVAEGRADFGVGAADVLIANDRGRNLAIVAPIFQTSAAAFYYRPDTQIQSLADLMDLEVARRIGDLPDVEFQAMLKAEGLDPNKVDPHEHQAGIEHLLDGRVDLIPGYTISLPFTAQNKGVKLRHISPSTYGIDFYGDSLFTRQALIESDPDLVARFRRATIKGWRYALDNSAGLAGRIAFALPRTAPLSEDLRFGFNLYQTDGVRALTGYPEIDVGSLNPERWRKMHEVLQGLGLVEGEFERRDVLFDPDFEEDLQARMTQYWLGGGVLIFAILVVVFLSWNRTLKLQVKARTKELERYSALFEGVFLDVPDAMVVADTSHNIVTVNPCLERVFGYRQEELVGKRSSVLYERIEDYNRELDVHFSPNAAPNTKPYEVNYLRKDGTTFPGETVGSPVRDQSGQVIAFICVIRDITSRKAAEQALELSEKRLRTIIDTVPSMIFVKNAEGRFLACNKAVADNYGLTVEDVAGRKQSDVHPNPAEVERMLETDRKVIESGDVHYYEQEGFEDEKGNTRWLQTVKAACPASVFGEPTVIGNAVDITLLKQTEEELRRVLVEAEQANQAKSDFLASMSHELRTPLNAILGFAQMLQYDPSNPLSEGQLENLNHIVEGGEHLLQLVNEVLDLERIEANEYNLALEEVDPGEILAECVEQSQRQGTSRGIRIVNNYDKKAKLHVRTDPVRLKQILINLLSNAVKYNRDEGSVTINSEVTKDDFLRISVTDTGIGISEEDQQQIFQMFHRVGGGGAYVAREGTGIGLAVTKLLVERLAGHIGVNSEEGKGSTFWVELPLLSNQETLIWGDALRVGVDEIDRDHQILISLLNRTTRTKIDEDGLNEVLWDLLDYTRYHFRREEAIMEVCEYADIEAHMRIHTRLTDQVNDIVAEWEREHDPEILRRLRVLLRNWLADHIMHVDTTIAAYTKGKDKAIVKALENVS